MGTMEETLKCPVCQDFFIDPVTLQCGHDFCLTCIQAVWETDVSDEGPFFCPECQIFLPSDLTLKINADLQTKVKDFTTKTLSAAERQAAASTSETKLSSTICCDHCIEMPSVAIRTCLTCDASLCQAHALLHQQRSALREHTVVEVTSDPLSLKCREHRDELKLFCMEEKVPVCCLCVLVGTHKHHKASQLHEAKADFKVIIIISFHYLWGIFIYFLPVVFCLVGWLFYQRHVVFLSLEYAWDHNEPATKEEKWSWTCHQRPGVTVYTNSGTTNTEITLLNCLTF